MSYDEKTTWTCDYCEKQEVTNGTSWMKPGGWVHNKLIWNEHYQMNVQFCRECFNSIFEKDNPNNVVPKGMFKKPFWRRFFKNG